ncbi:MAG: ectonucleotide pyrophosphatase/phosphodiesterase, partial [Woeseia sp.]
MNSMIIRFVGQFAAMLSIASMLLTAASGFAADEERAQQPYLLLISIDGFRHDYQARYPTPALDRISERGVRAESVQPAWPSLTFPNHYSIVTGLYPADHGIVANEFPDDLRESWYRYKDSATVQDGRWYAGVPLWVAAERAGMISATYFFVGSEARIGDVSPSHWRAFDAGVSGADRVTQILDWLALPVAERPQMLGLYFEQVDVAAHRHGPGSTETVAAIRQVDRWIGELLDGIEQAGLEDQLHIAVVSDHGQSEFRRDPEPLVLADFLELDGVTVRASGAFAMLYLDEPDPARARELRDAINARWQHG